MSEYQNGASSGTAVDPEVVLRAKRRQFSAQEKQRILQEAEACTEPGQVGALLRREGIYASHLSAWRREQKADQAQRLSAKQRGRPNDEARREVSQLRRENEQLKEQLAQAELIISAQKKLAQALEQTLSRSKDR